MSKSEPIGYVQNAQALLDHGDLELRAHALAIVEQVLLDVDPYARTLRAISFRDNVLAVGGIKFDLQEGQRVWFLGAGKASFPIAKAVEDALGDRLHDGMVVCKGEQRGRLQRIQLFQADHPIPSEASVFAAERMLAMASKPIAGDIVVCGITGGSSSLLTLPCAGLHLEDLQQLTALLLTCGANIFEINAVRKHASQIGGGRLALALQEGVRLINITASDVVGDALDYITDPTVADTSTLDAARSTLTKYDLWSRVTPAVRTFFSDGGQARETPKELPWPPENTILLLSAASAPEAAFRAAQQLGYQPMILSSYFDCESATLGHVFASLASEIVHHKRPLPRPCALIGGGETFVTMKEFGGHGGPNQEFSLAGALRLPDRAASVLLGLDTDGTDGPTNIAGGLCDSQTRARGYHLGLDLNAALTQHETSEALTKLGDAIVTGATGSNVNDLKLLLIR